jgi:hypothetical protein
MMPKSVDSNLENRSDVSVPAAKAKVFLETNNTFDNIRTYVSWKVRCLEETLDGELKFESLCCKKVRPRCRMCHEKRAYWKYTSIRRKFVALKRLQEMCTRVNPTIKGTAV